MTPRLSQLPVGAGICYSGYRAGQAPGGALPTRAQVLEDLQLLARHWTLLRLYDAGPHGALVLEVIEQERLPLRVLLGAHLGAELSNPQCPWGAMYSEAELAAMRLRNDEEVQRAIALARRHSDLVWAVAVGNEVCVDWSDHRVPLERLIAQVRTVRNAVAQPVTVCDNHVPWRDGSLRALAAELDFLSLHSYPVWEGRGIDAALACTQADWQAVRQALPGQLLAITEAGWPTVSGGHAIAAESASDALQARYLRELRDWCARDGVLAFQFEAFDEDWKGSGDARDPEKHWGVFTIDRRAKQAVADR